MKLISQVSKAAKPTINHHRFSLGDKQLFEPGALLTKDQKMQVTNQGKVLNQQAHIVIEG
jgi:hypothetical protein